MSMGWQATCPRPHYRARSALVVAPTPHHYRGRSMANLIAADSDCSLSPHHQLRRDFICSLLLRPLLGRIDSPEPTIDCAMTLCGRLRALLAEAASHFIRPSSPHLPRKARDRRARLRRARARLFRPRFSCAIARTYSKLAGRRLGTKSATKRC